MGLQEWINQAIEKKASEDQIRDALHTAGYPETRISEALAYRGEILSAAHHKQLGYLIMAAGVAVAIVAIIVFIFA